MTIIPYGDSALLINFEQRIDPTINESVIKLGHYLEQTGFSEITFIIPAYCSLTVGFDPRETDFHSLKKRLEKVDSLSLTSGQPETRRLIIPVCYDVPFALDQNEMINYTKLPWEEIVSLHTSAEYRVYMLGFLPGFVYMGSIPAEIFAPRKKNPRLKVPALSVGIAGLQTGIYPSAAPGGWQIIGKTPIRIFDSRLSEPFLFEAGMIVKFRSITRDELYELESQIEHESFNQNSLYE